MNSPVARLDRIHLALGGRPLFQGLSLRIERGERLAVVGDNGAGKSTLLDLLVGVRTPDAGRVEILGRPPPSGEVGFVPQEAGASLLPWLRARDNALLPLRARRVGRRERQRRLDEVRALLDPDGTIPLDAHPETLSGGQRQLVAIMRAVVARPALLVCDEPTSALDGGARVRLRHALATLTTHPCGPALVLVTHDPADLPGVADETVRLSGRPAVLEAC